MNNQYTKRNIQDTLINIYKEYDIFAKETSVEDIDIYRPFETMGVNSVDYIKTIVGIENEFDFEFDDDDLSIDRFKCLSELIDFIYEKKCTE